MNFKYFENFEKFCSMTKEPKRCQICNENKICFDSAFYGTENIEQVCSQCIYDKNLFGRKISTNSTRKDKFLNHLMNFDKSLSENEAIEIANKLTKEIEQATPYLLTWQDMDWPFIDGDFAKFVAFGSKAFFNSHADDGNGKKLFNESIHEELLSYKHDDDWEEMLPDDLINNLEESEQYGVLYYVFQSLKSDNLIIWKDSD